MQISLRLVFMNGLELDISTSFTQSGISISSNLTWNYHMHFIAKPTSQKTWLSFLEPMAISHLLNCKQYKNPISFPSLEHCSHVWGHAPKPLFHLLDKVQSKAIHLNNNPNITKTLQSLCHHHLVADFPGSITILTDIALLKSRILFLSSEACSINQKHYSITPFPCYTT